LIFYPKILKKIVKLCLYYTNIRNGMEEEYNQIIRYRSSILLGMFIILSILLFTFLITVMLIINSDRQTTRKITILKIELLEAR